MSISDLTAYRLVMPSTPPSTATIHAPSWLWGNNPARFWQTADLHARLIDASSGVWQVKTNERHTNVAPNLVETHHLAGVRQTSPRFDRLAVFAGPPLRGPVSERERRALDERTERVMQTKDLVDAFSVFNLRTMLAEQQQLPEIAGHVYSELQAFRFKERPADQVFPDAGVHVVRRRDALTHRIKMAGVLVRVENDDQLRSGDLRGIQAARNAGELVFASSEHLLNGATFLDAYLGPLLGAVSPAIWGLSATREWGVVFYSLGRPIRGWKGDAAEPLQLIPMPGPSKPVPTPSVSAAACSEAVEWWNARLNDFLGVLTDPTIFTDEVGSYVPVKHIQAVTTTEQLFRRVTSLQVSHRDVTARRLLFFSVLDTLERLTGRNIETHCSLTFALKTLERLRAVIPSAAAELLLPSAERAVDALRGVQDGFYLMRQSGASHIDVYSAGTIVNSLTPEKAAVEYIKMLRNATHGFGSNRSGQVALANALLAHHDGDLPHDLALLGYLYLLDILAQPEVTRSVLYRSGRL